VCAEISRLITGVQATDLQQSVAKVGIRSQIFDPKAQSLVNDFVVVEEARVVHVLNAISPAFTASFAFADYLLDQYR
jgi:(S)-2-hydroxyglutarate dehydrogenase